jgi:hypothetical protein
MRTRRRLLSDVTPLRESRQYRIGVVTGGPRLGDAEAGAVAALAGPRVSVVSGGLACLAGVALLAWRLPELDRTVIEPSDTGAQQLDL